MTVFKSEQNVRIIADHSSLGGAKQMFQTKMVYIGRGSARAKSVMCATATTVSLAGLLILGGSPSIGHAPMVSTNDWLPARPQSPQVMPQSLRIVQAAIGDWSNNFCYVDVFPNDDGTFTPNCYCGWSEDPHSTLESAECAAEAHQNRSDV